ncbi:MAG: hypothetical protein FJW23_01930 [Acidimicrobiia bacterium]|nr:hypothetical protein [Acidimicrobiia bacterium]
MNLSEGHEATPAEPTLELRTLFHQLNNQLGIVLAHAELLESRATTDVERARAAQMVNSVLEAMGISRAIRAHVEQPARQ